MDLSRRQFGQLASLALASFLTDPLSRAGTVLSPLTVETVSTPTMLGFIKLQVQSRLAFSASSVGAETSPYHSILALQNPLSLLVDCCERNLIGKPLSPDVSPQHFLLQILSNREVWQNQVGIKISLLEWQEFRKSLAADAQLLTNLEDTQLLAHFSALDLTPATLAQSAERISDPMMRQIHLRPLSQALANQGEIGLLRQLIGYVAPAKEEAGVWQKIANIRQAMQAQEVHGLSDVIDFFQHLETAGFSQFPAGSRLAHLQKLAETYHQVHRLMGVKEHFPRLQRLASKLVEEANSLEFPLPQSARYDSCRFSRSYDEDRARQLSKPNHRVSHYESQILRAAGLPDTFYLIYDFSKNGAVIRIREPEQQKVQVLHVQHSPQVNGLLRDLLWNNCREYLFAENGSRFFQVKLSPEGLRISPLPSPQSNQAASINEIEQSPNMIPTNS